MSGPPTFTQGVFSFHCTPGKCFKTWVRAGAVLSHVNPQCLVTERITIKLQLTGKSRLILKLFSYCRVSHLFSLLELSIMHDSLVFKLHHFWCSEHLELFILVLCLFIVLRLSKNLFYKYEGRKHSASGCREIDLLFYRECICILLYCQDLVSCQCLWVSNRYRGSDFSKVSKERNLHT